MFCTNMLCFLETNLIKEYTYIGFILLKNTKIDESSLLKTGGVFDGYNEDTSYIRNR